MYQRVEDHPEPERPRLVPVDQEHATHTEEHVTEHPGLSTADLARAGESPHVEAKQSARPAGSVGTLDATQPTPIQGNQASDGHAALFKSEEARDFRTRWTDIQAGFVDEPRHAVEQADELVANVIKRLAEVFADERTRLEHQWDRGDQISTEDLRLALQRYRSFFDRLLNV